MSVYGGAGDAYRDTTKWMAASVPLATLVAAGVALGPRVVQSVQTASSVSGWVGGHWLVLLCGAAVVGAVAWVLATGARVLSAGPSLPVELVKDPDGAVGKAIGDGVALPYYGGAPSFYADLDAWLEDIEAPDADPAMPDSRLDRLVPSLVAIGEWSALHEIEVAYKDFRRAFGLGVLCIVLAILVAPVQLPSGPAVTAPTPVTVEVGQAGADDLWSKTGCTDPMMSTFTAVAGTWDAPVLAVDGPDCPIGATWVPSRTDADVRPVRDAAVPASGR
ncbi:conserved membrane hypothetical protein [Nostocoides japonicum T1-X7]|uniref:Uncharacterized protein n=1 Tax=Nostocoides japonicum T1-X7 TaxID=1194083 RepID=A0A077LST3_9MICO|nr:hypothetical protein [Tetrasphaera japonica]CCH75911.1 conserved membrane hypothetical protein [Tetrasphaera japonica T1-X7]